MRSRDMLQAVAREMRKYDVLGQPSKIKYIPSVMRSADVTPHDRGLWQCAHAVALDQYCKGCERHSVDRFVYVGMQTYGTMQCPTVLFVPADTRVYVQAKLLRIREVLKILGMLP